MIGRYGGCFEEDIRRLMCDRAYHITGFGCTGEVCTNSQGEKGQCAVPQRLENCGRLRVRLIHGLTLVIKNSYTYCKSLLALEAKYYYAFPQRDRLVGKDHRSSPTATHKESNKRTPMCQNCYTTFTIRACYGTRQLQHKYFSISQLLNWHTLILPPLYLKTLVKYQTSHDIQ